MTRVSVSASAVIVPPLPKAMVNFSCWMRRTTGLSFALNILAKFFDLFVTGRVVGDELFGQTNRAQGQTEQAIGIGGIGDRKLDAAAADVEEQTEREMKAQAAHDAEADEPGFVFFG